MLFYPILGLRSFFSLEACKLLILGTCWKPQGNCEGMDLPIICMVFVRTKEFNAKSKAT